MRYEGPAAEEFREDPQDTSRKVVEEFQVDPEDTKRTAARVNTGSINREDRRRPRPPLRHQDHLRRVELTAVRRILHPDLATVNRVEAISRVMFTTSRVLPTEMTVTTT